MLSYGASRNAIRLALDLLRTEGVVQRVQGVGTLITRDSWTSVPLDEPLGLDEALHGGATRVTYQTLAAVSALAPPGVADRLEIAPGSPVVFHERVALVDNEPLTLRSAWIPMELGAPIIEGRVELRRGIFEVLEDGLGFELGVTEFSIEASLADAAVATILAVPVASALLLIESLTRLADGRPAEFGYGRSRADRVRLARQAVRRSPAATELCRHCPSGGPPNQWPRHATPQR